MARQGSACCYGVARQREGSRQNSIGGSGVLSLRHFSGWFSLSLGAWVPKKLARRRMQLWLMASAAPSASPRPDRNGAMLLDRLGPPGFRFNDFRAPRLSYLSPLARARALLARPWSARCYGVARQREGSRQNSIGGSGVLSLRHFGLVLFIPWRVGAEEAGAAKDAIMAYGFGGAGSFAPPRTQRRDAARPARAA